jgi:citrate lyase beta subunit
LLSLLGLRRPRGKTLYQTPIGPVISGLVTIFKPNGFDLVAPVLEHFHYEATLHREVREDLDHGLVGKTAIHPDQVRWIEVHYQVSLEDLETAKRLLSASAPAVFEMHGSMCEPTTHSNWAKHILKQAEAYGVREVSVRPDGGGETLMRTSLFGG